MSQNDVKDRLRPFGLTFEKSLSDLIRGMRSHREPEAQLKFLQDAVVECRREVRSREMERKTTAVLKLAYLEMCGFDMSWSNFHVLEVMSSPKFQQKRVGYLAAIQSFRNDNDVLMLTTNLLKKDLNSSRAVEVGLALSGISAVVTTALAADIVDDIIRMLNHSKPYIRKKAVLAMYKIFLKYPEALRTHLPRIFDKLDDDDDSVVTATVTVICELSKKTPKILVSLAPHLYDLLKSSSNNWMLIRLLKLFSSLTTVEPRLKNKLLDPVLELMAKTRASSLIFECVNCLVSGDMIGEDDYQIANLCLEELVQFFKEDDPNLRYVGLLAFLKIGKINLKFISKYSEDILVFIQDDDITIRSKALGLVDGIVDDDNCFEIVKKLMIQLVPKDEMDDEDALGAANGTESLSLVPPALKQNTKPVLTDNYKRDIVFKILQISSQDNYANIPSFEWYLAVISDLIDLSIVNSIQTGEALGEQLRDIAVRVPSIRKDVIATSIKILNNESVLTKLPQALKQVIWLTGEYSQFIKNGDVLIKNILLNDHKLLQLNYDILALYIPSIIKIYNNYVNKDPSYWDNIKRDSIMSLTNKIVLFLESLSNSKHFEIQERSVEFLEFLKLIMESIDQHDLNAMDPPLLLTQALPSLFDSWELNPVAHNSQKRLPPPDFDIDSPINEDMFDTYYRSDDEESELEEFEEKLYEDHGFIEEDQQMDESAGDEPFRGPKEIEQRKKERLEKLKDDPYYLSGASTSQIISPKTISSNTPRSITPTVEVEDVPIKPKKKKKNVLILSDEVIGNVNNEASDQDSLKSSRSATNLAKPAKKRNLLKIDSSNLDNFQFEETSNVIANETEIGALEVAKLREQLSKQHINQQDDNNGDEEEVVIVRKKKKEKKLDEYGNPVEKKKKKKKSSKTKTSSSSKEVTSTEP